METRDNEQPRELVDPSKLLKPEDYEWLQDFIRAAVPDSLLADIATYYDASMKESAGLPSETLMRGLRDLRAEDPQAAFC